MAEYIEREAALNAFEYADYDVVTKYGDDGFSFDTVERIIRNIPAADVRPVVKAIWKHVQWVVDDAFKAQITDGRFYCMKDGVLHELEVAMPKGKIVNLPPIEYAEPQKEG